MNEQMDKARLGAIGENNVVSMLMQHGWDAFNANCSIKNYKSIDIICINSEGEKGETGEKGEKATCESSECPWKPQIALIQVKTSRQTDIPIGFNIKQCLNEEYLKENVKGAYVFVYIKDKDGKPNFRYFILSREQFIKLAHKSQRHYTNGYNRAKDLKYEAPALLKIKWLEGKGEEATDKHEIFNNPLNGISCEDCWDNIWIE